MRMLKSLLRSLPRGRKGTIGLEAVEQREGRVAPGDGSCVVPMLPDPAHLLRGEAAIELIGVKKSLGLPPQETEVLKGVDVIFPRGRAVGILGAPSAGKSTLIQILTANWSPDAGRVIHGMRVSWPLGARDIFRKNMSIRANVRMLSLMYGAWAPDMIDAVKEIGKIRDHDMDKRLTELVPDFIIRASTSLCYALDFDCYVADDLLCAGTKQFREHIKELMLQRRKTHSLIIATKSGAVLRDMYDDLYLLEGGIIKPHRAGR